MFAGYKTSEGIDPALFSQFELAEDVCRALGMLVWPMIEFEADDALSSAAARYAEQPGVEQVVICSPDKDLLQCVVGQRVVTWDRLRKKVYDEPAVREKLGILPASVPDYLALVGDSADGIPGIPRWGARSAAQMLAHYGHLENIPHDCAQWAVRPRGAQALADTLSSLREASLLYRTLATLRRDAPINPQLEDLRYRGPDEVRRSELLNVLGS